MLECTYNWWWPCPISTDYWATKCIVIYCNYFSAVKANLLDKVESKLTSLVERQIKALRDRNRSCSSNSDFGSALSDGSDGEHSPRTQKIIQVLNMLCDSSKNKNKLKQIGWFFFRDACHVFVGYF
ncbi:uncharacterized protein LOC127244374 isoform X2 [Andrographis paniculata]|uniref:uncharacterized protein LOC127244374 isoform X2 n=1 Tax=Andrographis paniculata TaxID=175694 RepID=UPI0021E724EF|nr:uncharacterized protein LOC127244374 isoform X2 [Andrographis paniculata]